MLFEKTGLENVSDWLIYLDQLVMFSDMRFLRLILPRYKSYNNHRFITKINQPLADQIVSNCEFFDLK